jgi:hypothetical protein
MERYTTGDKVLFEGEEWYVYKAEWVWIPWDNDPDYCQRLGLIQFDENKEICNSASNIRNTDIEGRVE